MEYTKALNMAMSAVTMDRYLEGKTKHEIFESLSKLSFYLEDMTNLIPYNEWGEEDGDCLWWDLPIEEPPYCGNPLDCDFPEYKTHFTRFIIPNESEGDK